MRKILALVLTGAVAVGVVGFATADESVQKESFKLKPTKLDKKKFKNVKYVNLITTSDMPGTSTPPSATRTVLDYSKNFKFNYNKFPTCKVTDAQLAAASDTDAAKSLCGKGSQVSQDSGSNATIKVNSAVTIPVDVVAFNAKNKSLYLYSKPTGAFNGIAAQVLTGKLKSSKAGKKYGQALDVTIPKIDAGAISTFKVTIPKSKYVQARCKSKKIPIQATTYFSNGPVSKSTDKDQVKCKQKKSKKHKKHHRHHRHH